MIDFLADLLAHGIVFGGASAMTGRPRRKEITREEIAHLPQEEQDRILAEQATRQRWRRFGYYIFVHDIIFLIVWVCVGHSSTYMYPYDHYRTQLIVGLFAPPVVVFIGVLLANAHSKA